MIFLMPVGFARPKMEIELKSVNCVIYARALHQSSHPHWYLPWSNTGVYPGICPGIFTVWADERAFLLGFALVNAMVLQW